jgi:FixJ family two-component response regulator
MALATTMDVLLLGLALLLVMAAIFGSSSPCPLCIKAGAVAFLLKPVNNDDLLSTIRQALGESNGGTGESA